MRDCKGLPYGNGSRANLISPPFIKVCSSTTKTVLPGSSSKYYGNTEVQSYLPTSCVRAEEFCVVVCWHVCELFLSYFFIPTRFVQKSGTK